jgi:hypothetical protein
LSPFEFLVPTSNSARFFRIEIIKRHGSYSSGAIPFFGSPPPFFFFPPLGPCLLFLCLLTAGWKSNCISGVFINFKRQELFKHRMLPPPKSLRSLNYHSF